MERMIATRQVREHHLTPVSSSGASRQSPLFDCYPSGTVILTQLGVLGNLADALQQPASA
jgi:hypothetical protein